MSPGRRLRAFRQRLGLSLRKAAVELGVSYVALQGWECGRALPSDDHRTLIEAWSSGKVPASIWPLSKRARRVAARAAELATHPRYRVRTIHCGECHGAGTDEDGEPCPHCGGTGSLGFERQRKG